MKTGEAEHWVREQLRTIYDEHESSAITAWVIEKVCNMPRPERMKNKDSLLADDQRNQLTVIVQRLQKHEPVQYVLGESYFYGLTLYVDNSVLIPRPETEELVAWIVNDVRAQTPGVLEKGKTDADATISLRILDVGTGSGCIALALKKELPKAEVWGCDKSEAALNVARRNGAALDIRVDFQNIDFLDAAQWASLPPVNLIVSNPPYITQKEAAFMQPNVVQHEPHSALFVPDENPMLFYEALALFGKEKVHNRGCLYVEIHEAQGAAVVQLFKKHMYASVELKRDMQGKDRMVKAEISDKK